MTIEDKVEDKVEDKPKPVKRKGRKKNFLNNGDLYAETVKSQENGRMTEKLASMLITLCDKYKKSSQGDFTRYTYFNEMK